MGLRHQLPVLSPLSVSALMSAAWTLVSGRDRQNELTAQLRATFNARSAVLCSSGTDALGRAIALTRSRNSELIVGLPAYACFDVATAAVAANARVELYDIDPITLGPAMDSLRRVMRSGVSSVVIAPFCGMPVDWPAIAALAAETGTVLIEDAAQGQGATLNGSRLGSLGDLSVLSFGRGKGWTGGRGGALLVRTSHEPAAAVADSSELAVLAASVVQWAVGRPALYGLPAALPWLGLGDTRYRDPVAAARLTRVGVTLALATAAPAAAAASRRAARAAVYAARAPWNDDLRSVQPIADAQPGYLRYPVLLRNGQARALGARTLGIAAAYPAPLARLPALRERLRAPQARWPGAEELAQDLITLPTHDGVTMSDQERILAWLKSQSGDVQRTYSVRAGQQPVAASLLIL